jgi:hypothetical protein
VDGLLEEDRITVFENVFYFDTDCQHYHRHDKGSEKLLDILTPFLRSGLVSADVLLIFSKDFLNRNEQLFPVVEVQRKLVEMAEEVPVDQMTD